MFPKVILLLYYAQYSLIYKNTQKNAPLSMNRVNLRSIEYKLLFSPVCLYVIKTNQMKRKINSIKMNSYLFLIVNTNTDED